MVLSSEMYDSITENLHNVIDPELAVSIVDLGLIYDLNADEDNIYIKMTLTYAGCPLTDILEDDINNALLGFQRAIKIEWVWSPPWDTSMVTEEGRDQLRALGMYI